MIHYKNSLRKFNLLLFLCFNILNLFSQNNNSGLASSLNPKENRNILEDRSTWKEVVSERKIFSSTYLTPDARIITHYSKQPLNYYNSNGILIPVDIQPVSTIKGLTANHQPNEVSLLTNGSIEIHTGDGSTLIFSKNYKINGTIVSASSIKQDGLNSTMLTNISGVTKTFEFRFNSLKYNYVLNTPITTLSTDFIIEEEISMPENSKIQPDVTYGKQDARGWLGPLLIVSDNGKELGTMRGAVCYDANNNYITAAYQFEKINGKQKIKIIVPNSWINDPSRVYPITIDPLVTGPTATFTGSFIPSCISPASASDSILVTIPANISVTGFFVSGSFYADPFSTAIMNDGAMFFSTSCNTSSSFTTTGAAGLSPGTAYLTEYDLKNPLLCCIPQSCSIQTFYLSMHITRTVGGTGCNTSYIYHDPFGGYPFSAYVEGRTIEGFGPLFTVTPTTVCSNECTITGTVYIKYGVPPFTITHPWMSGSVSVGTPAGCSTASNIKVLTLDIPNCPWTCDTISTLTVPSPTIIDACGTVLTGTPTDNITIKEVPEVTASPSSITICSGETFSTTITPCLGTSVISWSGNSTSGNGTTISQTLTNTGTTVSSTVYQVSAVNNSCQSDTITVTVNTVPIPIASFNASPQPVVVNTPLIFTDNTAVFGDTANSWFWTFGDGFSGFYQNPTYVYSATGTYTVCLAMQTTEGCVDTVCQEIEVIPLEIIVHNLVFPNVVTPNGDNMNDALYFKDLEFFGTNKLEVFNRWGQLVYQKDNYLNDWVPDNVSDGTYYYILTIENGEKYTRFLEIFK